MTTVKEQMVTRQSFHTSQITIIMDPADKRRYTLIRACKLNRSNTVFTKHAFYFPIIVHKDANLEHMPAILSEEWATGRTEEWVTGMSEGWVTGRSGPQGGVGHRDEWVTRRSEEWVTGMSEEWATGRSGSQGGVRSGPQGGVRSLSQEGEGHR